MVALEILVCAALLPWAVLYVAIVIAGAARSSPRRASR